MSFSSSEPVDFTTHIHFNKKYKTFSLFSGNSLYSFCVGPELTLEHLYWGVKLQTGYDLRYSSESIRNVHFNTVEASPLAFGGKIFSKAETFDEVQKTWKANNSMGKQVPFTDIASQQRRRLENYSWRILSKASQDERKDGFRSNMKLSPTFRKSKSNTPISSDRPWNIAALDLSSASPKHVANQVPSLGDGVSGDAVSGHAAYLPGSSVRASSRYHQRHSFDRNLGKLGKGALCCEYSDHGTGDFRSPSFMVVDNANGSSISPLRYKRHAIYRGKLPMPDSLPGIRCLSEREASTLVVTMADAITGLEVDLVYGE